MLSFSVSLSPSLSLFGEHKSVDTYTITTSKYMLEQFKVKDTDANALNSETRTSACLHLIVLIRNSEINFMNEDYCKYKQSSAN